MKEILKQILIWTLVAIGLFCTSYAFIWAIANNIGIGWILLG